MGRKKAARLELEGPDAALEALEDARLGI